MLGNQISPAAQPEKTLFQQRQRLGRGDAEKRQPIAFAPGVPGTARAPEAFEPVGEALDVVALDHQRTAIHLDLADARRAAGLVQMALIEQRIGLRQHRQHRRFFLAANRPQTERPALDAEQRAFAADLDQEVLEAPACEPCRSASASASMGKACSPLLSR